jgi:hypothetical protein
MTTTKYDRILALAKALVADERKSLALAEARGRLPPGSSRARGAAPDPTRGGAAERRDRTIESLVTECTAVLGLVPR